tara:strand:+ start:197 stop:325 length:129 start_codon:yes stop_codon:yes gene_type:complete
MEGIGGFQTLLVPDRSGKLIQVTFFACIFSQEELVDSTADRF